MKALATFQSGEHSVSLAGRYMCRVQSLSIFWWVEERTRTNSYCCELHYSTLVLLLWNRQHITQWSSRIMNSCKYCVWFWLGFSTTTMQCLSPNGPLRSDWNGKKKAAPSRKNTLLRRPWKPWSRYSTALLSFDIEPILNASCVVGLDLDCLLITATSNWKHYVHSNFSSWCLLFLLLPWIWQEKCDAEKAKTIANRKTWHYVYFDITIGGEAAGVVFK